MRADRELLELAAKAAGIALREVHIPGCPFYFVNTATEVEWNPLVSDGDALRLAVRLQLTICNEHLSCGAAYCTRSDEEFIDVFSGSTDDAVVIPEDYAATRRAIVLAAAAIGEATP